MISLAHTFPFKSLIIRPYTLCALMLHYPFHSLTTSFLHAVLNLETRSHFLLLTVPNCCNLLYLFILLWDNASVWFLSRRVSEDGSDVGCSRERAFCFKPQPLYTLQNRNMSKLTPYELERLENIKRNEELMRTLGIFQSDVETKRKPVSKS